MKEDIESDRNGMCGENTWQEVTRDPKELPVKPAFDISCVTPPGEDLGPLTGEDLEGWGRRPLPVLGTSISHQDCLALFLPEAPSAGSALSQESLYGRPAPAKELARALPAGKSGLTWEATLVSATWSDAQHCFQDGKIKPRRPILPVRIPEFLDSLAHTEDDRWIFSGVLNGWPGLTCLELRQISRRRTLHSDVCWDAQRAKSAPSCPRGAKAVTATLRMPPWSLEGWSKESPGWVWWFHAQRKEGPSLSFGSGMLQELESYLQESGRVVPRAASAHLFYHRYAVRKRRETREERNTYNAAVLLEWDHGLYCTVVELGPVNSIIGHNGRSDWHHDKLEDTTLLARCAPACMVLPWKADRAEIRCSDVAARSIAEFKEFVAMYEGHHLRFVDPRFTHSSSVQIYHRSQAHIMLYLLNYIAHDASFELRTRNCQSFACDLYSLLCNGRDVRPLNPAMANNYLKRVTRFLYGSSPTQKCRAAERSLSV